MAAGFVDVPLLEAIRCAPTRPGPKTNVKCGDCDGDIYITFNNPPGREANVKFPCCINSLESLRGAFNTPCPTSARLGNDETPMCSQADADVADAAVQPTVEEPPAQTVVKKARVDDANPPLQPSTAAVAAAAASK